MMKIHSRFIARPLNRFNLVFKFYRTAMNRFNAQDSTDSSLIEGANFARAARRRDADCDRRVLGHSRHSTIENHRLSIALPELYLKTYHTASVSFFFFQIKLTFQLDQFTCEHCGHCARTARRRNVDRDRRVLGQNRHSTQQFPITKVPS